MKRFPIYVFIISCVLFNSSCNNKKQSQEEQKHEQFEEAFIATEKLQKKAAQDSNFAKSREYSSQMEKANIEMSKKTFNMNENEKSLLEFEVSLINLKQYTNQLKKHPKLSRNVSFMETIQAEADKVRKYQQILKKANLNPQEKEKFEELSHK